MAIELFCRVRALARCALKACCRALVHALASIVARYVATMSTFVTTELGRLPTQGHLLPCMQALPCAWHGRDV